MIRRAVLIFADRLTADLGRRRWSRRFAGLLSLPQLGGGGEWDVHLFSPGIRESLDDPFRHRQVGGDFGQRLEHAVKTLADAGYDHVVVAGRDCPDLSRHDVRRAFDALGDGRELVLGPDQGGGCWLIGLSTNRRDLLAGVRWRCGRDFDELLRRGGEATIVFDAKVDLDSSADLRLLSRLCRTWRRVLKDLLAPVPSANPAAPPPRTACLRALRRYQLPPPLLGRLCSQRIPCR